MNTTKERFTDLSNALHERLKETDELTSKLYYEVEKMYPFNHLIKTHDNPRSKSAEKEL